jgi:hypothetical protein
MKKLYIAVVLCIGLMLVCGCTATPPDTVTVKDILEKGSELLGQHVVVFGRAETGTPMKDMRLFYVYKDFDKVWVELPKDALSMPPQAEKIRVEGTLKKKKFTAMPDEQMYIEATVVDLE